MQTMRNLAFTGFAVAVVLLVLVLIPGIGKEANGSRGWFVIAGLSMQPSELAKIAFAIWGAHLLAARRMERASLREMLIPLVPAAVIALALIVAQPDLGQTVSLGIILLALLWYAGLPLRVFLGSLFAVVVSAAVLAMAEGYRSDRVMSWLNPTADSQGSGYQAKQARFALANGGVFGDGLGQGTAKWNYLPNAHNDFIFAIIGEELGFIGAAGLLGLFGLFAYTGMRIARRSADPFLRLLTATATMWVLGQAFINVGYVIGLLPVTGLQLPLISAGGTSTATTLLMIGVIANAARHEPEAVAALRAGREDRVNRLLRLPLPQPYSPTRTEALRDRMRSRGDKAAAKPKRKPPRKRRKPHTADRPVRSSVHHGGGQRKRLQRGWPAPPGPTGSHIGRSTSRVNGPISVVIAGGGTAGHIEPAMAVADALRALQPDVRITALGTRRGLETRLVPARGYHLELITPVPLPRKPSADLFRSMGGGLAVDATLTAPQRVWALVPIAAGLGGFEENEDEEAWWDALAPPIDAAIEAGEFERAQDLLLEIWAPLGVDDARGARIKQIARDNIHEMTMDESLAESLDPPAAQRLGEIDAPTLVVDATQDPPDMRRASHLIAQEVLDGRLVSIEADHVVNLRAPEAFDDAVLPFLEQHAPH